VSALCSVEGCDRKTKARALCSTHHARWSRTGDIRADQPIPIKVRKYDALCAVESCGRPAESRGWCMAHYKRVLANGDVNASRPLNGVVKICVLEGCERRVNCKQMCSPHYKKLRLYDITVEQMVDLEAGRVDCAICGCVATDVDHCHDSGRVRGFLCNPCNRALAATRDDAEILHRAADYLVRFQARIT